MLPGSAGEEAAGAARSSTGGEGAGSGFSPTGVDEQPLVLVAEKEEAIGAVEGKLNDAASLA